MNEYKTPGCHCDRDCKEYCKRVIDEVDGE